MAFTGATKRLALVTETDWGTLPGTPTYIHVPVADYNVKFVPENRQSNLFTGLMQKKHSRNHRGMPSGSLVAPLFGWRPTGSVSLAEFLLSWAFGSHETMTLPSKSAEWAEGPNVANKRHLGLRVNSATLEGSADSGIVQVTLDLMGKTEEAVATAQSLPSTRYKAVEFEFPDVVLTLDGSVLPISQFTLAVQHSIKAEYLNSRTPSLLLKTTRMTTFNCTPVKASDAWDILRRTTDDQDALEMDAELVIKGLHQGTGSSETDYAVGTIDFPRLSLINVDEQGGRDDIAFQPLQFVALKPDSSDNDMTITWSEE